MKKAVSVVILLCFLVTSEVGNYSACAQAIALPPPGTMVNLSPAFEPVLIKGLKIHPENTFLFDFIIDTGSGGQSGDMALAVSPSRLPTPQGLNLKAPQGNHLNAEQLKAESSKLIKYFLAAMTVPEKDLWVNLSPYEKDRMIAPNLGQTEMGRDMLAQDYILKQLTASLIYPEKHLGKTFWDQVYAKTRQMYGTTQIPINTFNKVWIVADKADVFEHGNVAYVVGAHLKVMLEEDYLALKNNTQTRGKDSEASAEAEDRRLSPSTLPSDAGLNVKAPQVNSGSHDQDTHSIASNIIRQIILPQLEQEVNHGQNFAPLRQIFYSMILASWYKQALKNTILTQIYVNQSKLKGLGYKNSVILSEAKNLDDKDAIFQRYLQAYKKGVFNYIKDDLNPDGKTIPRKYFSGGTNFAMLGQGGILRGGQPWRNSAITGSIFDAAVLANPEKTDEAMAAKTGSIIVEIPGGIHIRPSLSIFNVTVAYPGLNIFLEYQGERINVKDGVNSILTLGVQPGATVNVEIDGGTPKERDRAFDNLKRILVKGDLADLPTRNPGAGFAKTDIDEAMLAQLPAEYQTVIKPILGQPWSKLHSELRDFFMKYSIRRVIDAATQTGTAVNREVFHASFNAAMYANTDDDGQSDYDRFMERHSEWKEVNYHLAIVKSERNTLEERLVALDAIIQGIFSRYVDIRKPVCDELVSILKQSKNPILKAHLLGAITAIYDGYDVPMDTFLKEKARNPRTPVTARSEILDYLVQHFKDEYDSYGDREYEGDEGWIKILMESIIKMGLDDEILIPAMSVVHELFRSGGWYSEQIISNYSGREVYERLKVLTRRPNLLVRELAWMLLDDFSYRVKKPWDRINSKEDVIKFLEKRKVMWANSLYVKPSILTNEQMHQLHQIIQKKGQPPTEYMQDLFREGKRVVFWEPYGRSLSWVAKDIADVVEGSAVTHIALPFPESKRELLMKLMTGEIKADQWPYVDLDMNNDPEYQEADFKEYVESQKMAFQQLLQSLKGKNVQFILYKNTTHLGELALEDQLEPIVKVLHGNSSARIIVFTADNEGVNRPLINGNHKIVRLSLPYVLSKRIPNNQISSVLDMTQGFLSQDSFLSGINNLEDFFTDFPLSNNTALALKDTPLDRLLFTTEWNNSFAQAWDGLMIRTSKDKEPPKSLTPFLPVMDLLPAGTEDQAMAVKTPDAAMVPQPEDSNQKFYTVSQGLELIFSNLYRFINQSHAFTAREYAQIRSRSKNNFKTFPQANYRELLFLIDISILKLYNKSRPKSYILTWWVDRLSREQKRQILQLPGLSIILRTKDPTVEQIDAAKADIREFKIVNNIPVDLGMISEQKSNGGIDLTRSKLNIQQEGSGLQMQFNQAMIARIRREGFDGLEFHIQSILPVANLPVFLGLVSKT